MGLFSGLEQFGLGNLNNMKLFEKEPKKNDVSQKKKAEEKPKQEVSEVDFLFDKSYKCPVCDQEFTSKTVKTGKLHLAAQDTDLRPKYKGIDTVKYDVVVCPGCGYAVLNRFFKTLMPLQVTWIKENITRNFRGLPEQKEGIYTYDYAVGNYQLALASAVVKKAKASEKAYTCLKMAWLCRGKAESMNESEPSYEEMISSLEEQEASLMLQAYEGFKEAFTKEDCPMCGMDELTVTYLLAELARRAGDYDESARYVSRILTSRVASERIKDKARAIKELVDEDKKTE